MAFVCLQEILSNTNSFAFDTLIIQTLVILLLGLTADQEIIKLLGNTDYCVEVNLSESDSIHEDLQNDEPDS
jgi:hypothetical protein